MSFGQAGLGLLTADVLLDPIEGGNLFQPLIGNRRCAGLGDFMELAPGVCPTIRQLDILGWPFEQPVVARIAVHLQGSCEAFEDALGVLAGSARCVSEGHARRGAAAPGAVIAGQDPEVSRLGFAATWVQHRRRGLIHEQLGGSLQVRQQRVMDGFEFKRRASDPGCQRRAVEIDALAAVNLGLPVQGKVVGVFGHDDMRHRGLCRHAAGDQVRGCRGLDDAALTGSAGILRPPCDDHPELRGDNVQPLADVLADHVPLAATVAQRGLGFDHFFDARQMSGQRSAVGLAGRRGPRRCDQWIGLTFGLDLGNRGLDILQRQLELIRIDLLGLAPEQRLFEGRDQGFQPCILLLLGQDDGLQGLDVIGKICRRVHGGDLSKSRRKHPPKHPHDSLCRSRRTCRQRLHFPPVQSGKQRLELGMVQ